jgi:hypothetical protein
MGRPSERMFWKSCVELSLEGSTNLVEHSGPLSHSRRKLGDAPLPADPMSHIPEGQKVRTFHTLPAGLGLRTPRRDFES